MEAASAGSTGPTGDDAPVASPRAAAEAEAMAALAELDTGGPADDEHEPGEYEDLGLLDADEAADGEQGDEKRGSEEK